jgi:hypothetical protein
MKKIAILFVLFCAISNINAQIALEIDENGNYYKEGISSNITADSVAVKYLKYFPLAIAKPNVFIPIEELSEVVRITSPFKTLIKTEKKGIVFNSQKKVVYFVFDKKNNEVFHPGLIIGSILWLISIILMSFTLLIGVGDDIKSSLFFVLGAALLAFLGGLFFLTCGLFIVSGLAILAACICAFVAFVRACFAIKRFYVVYIILYYIFMLIFLAEMFIGL